MHRLHTPLKPQVEADLMEAGVVDMKAAVVAIKVAVGTADGTNA